MKPPGLEAWVQDYLEFMVEKGFSNFTIYAHERILKHFIFFATKKSWSAHRAVLPESRRKFLNECRLRDASGAMTGFSRYLEEIGLLEKSPGPQRLPEIYGHYITWHMKTYRTRDARKMRIQKILWDFHVWLEDHHIRLDAMKIDQVDDFLKHRNQGLAPWTCADTRGIIKRFLRYLHSEKKILKRDLANMIVAAPVFAYENPPKYLRGKEIRKLFEAMDLSTNEGLRTHAIVRLAYTTGLRPSEIARIRLDDISFEKGELALPFRKGQNPIRLPVPEDTVKAMAAYIIGARTDSAQRHLFLSLSPPSRTITGAMVSIIVKKAMRRAGILATAYWLRHTYAQNLLESGASIFEIKEMLGHECIKVTKRYLHIHIKMMREVLFDD